MCCSWSCVYTLPLQKVPSWQLQDRYNTWSLHTNLCNVNTQVCQELERQAGRAKLVAAEGSVDLEYLKNIMLKLYETGELLMLQHLHFLLSRFQCV